MWNVYVKLDVYFIDIFLYGFCTLKYSVMWKVYLKIAAHDLGWLYILEQF